MSDIDDDIHFRYGEDVFLSHLTDHVEDTYSSHYAGGIQSAEFILANATTLDYPIGTAMKYLSRYGKKNGYNNTDLFKACHFIMMASHLAARLDCAKHNQ